MGKDNAALLAGRGGGRVLLLWGDGVVQTGKWLIDTPPKPGEPPKPRRMSPEWEAHEQKCKLFGQRAIPLLFVVMVVVLWLVYRAGSRQVPVLVWLDA